MTTQLLNFLQGLQVIMPICNDHETGADVGLEDGHDQGVFVCKGVENQVEP